METTKKTMETGPVMPFNRAKIVPTAVWLALLALGFVTNLEGAGKSRPAIPRRGETSERAALERSRTSPAYPVALRR